jgi:hypothetical protein
VECGTGVDARVDEPTMVDEVVRLSVVQVTTVNRRAITATETKPVRMAPPNSLSCQFGLLRFIHHKQSAEGIVPAPRERS